jgi:MoaA/NifB/PqqE/SkfB family radical SAM enzyme
MQRMEEALFRKILCELAEVNFGGEITFCGYNEPLADENFPAWVHLAREVLPMTLMQAVTNGDYLTSEKLHELYLGGLTRLVVSVYVDADKPGEFSYIKGMEAIVAMSKKIDLNTKIITQPNDVNCVAITRYGKTDVNRGLYIMLVSSNHKLTTNYRGGAVSKDAPVISGTFRDRMCIAPFCHFSIYYDGSVMPCSNLRPDFPGHVPFLYGNSNNNTLYEIFAGEASMRFRKNLVQDMNSMLCKQCIVEVEHGFFIESESA